VDGGRLRTRAADGGRGVQAAENKENKIACLVTLTSVEHAKDPQPEPPRSFVQPRRIQRLVQQMAGQASDPRAAADAPLAEPETQELSATPTAAVSDPQAEPWAPKRLLRTCVASMVASRSFGPLLAAEAQSRDFYAARRRAFVADGQAYNWSIQRGYFADFVPIVDLLHVVCYLFKAAQAVEVEAERWPLYLRWLRACWQGHAAEVVPQMEGYQERLGRPPPEDLPATDPRRLLAEALSYLRNNAERMDYPRYRQEGLPTTSSLVESLVGEFNARVKGKQKFWNRPCGAEAILQVRAAFLSEDGRLERYFAERPGSPYRRRAA
jgi:hypothetical protein